MFGSKVLDVAIGIIFLYILISILCSAIREGIEAWLKTRAAYLEHGIRELLHDRSGKGIAKDFFNHPLIYGLFPGKYTPGKILEDPGILSPGKNSPSYIPSSSFALALMDMAARGPNTDDGADEVGGVVLSLDAIRSNLTMLKNPKVQRVLLTALDSAEGDLTKLQANLEAWYNSAMERISGHYKRSTHWILFYTALTIAICLNINTLAIADYLYRNDSVRAAIAARAEGAVASEMVRTGNTQLFQDARSELDKINLPIGWSGEKLLAAGFKKGWDLKIILYDILILFSWIFGWILTAFAATLGAPFWFDVLKKVMVVRSTIKPGEKDAETSSDDRSRQSKSVDSSHDTGAQKTGENSTGSQPTIPGVVLQGLLDLEDKVDACEPGILTITSDEELPAAEGGVA